MTAALCVSCRRHPPICCEACSVLGLSVSVFIVPSKRTCSIIQMHAVQCAAYYSVSHRLAVEGEFKRQLRRLLYDLHVRPRVCEVCRIVLGMSANTVWFLLARQIVDVLSRTSCQKRTFCKANHSRISTCEYKVTSRLSVSSIAPASTMQSIRYINLPGSPRYYKSYLDKVQSVLGSTNYGIFVPASGGPSFRHWGHRKERAKH